MFCSTRSSRILLILLAGCLLFPALSSAGNAAGKGRIELISPTRIAFGDEVLFVSDYRQKAIFMVDKTTLKALRSFPVIGAPLGVAWSSGRVYVGNEATGRVEVYNPGGKHISDLGGPNGAIMRPTDIAIDETSGSVFVVDGSSRSVKVFDAGGALAQTISSPSLVNPTGIVLDPVRRELVVSDFGDPALKYPARVHIFDYSGNLLRSLSGRVGFSRPQGLAIDEGHVFLADALVGKVLVLDRLTGAVVKTLGSFGSGPGQLMLPLDVLLDPATRDVYVSNNRPGRIERFAEGGLL